MFRIDTTCVLFAIGSTIKRIIRLFPAVDVSSTTTDDGFRLVYFCGVKGIDYLRASLHSVRLSWNEFPRVLIITDGASPHEVRKCLGLAGGGIEIVSWESYACYFAQRGDDDLVRYAHEQLWGRKLLAILYSMAHYRTLYTDTDVLWFRDPADTLPPSSDTPVVKMSQDILPCFSDGLLNHLSLSLDEIPPLNAGVIFGHGDLSLFPDWKKMTRFLAESPDNRTEQTALAILATHFGTSWPMSEIRVFVNDINSILKSPQVGYQEIFARHYVNTKGWLLWRDYLWLLITHWFAGVGAIGNDR